jgi:hypothetical protein
MKFAKLRKRRVVKRPRNLLILVFLQVVQGVGLLIYSVYIGQRYGWGFQASRISLMHIAPFEVFKIVTSGMLFLVLAIFTLALAAALWSLSSWAWLAAMSLQGFSLFAALVGYLRGEPNYISMVLGILLVFYLNQQEVVAAFRKVAG